MTGEMTDGGIFWKMREGRGAMPSFKKLLTGEERWHLVNYLRALAHSHHDESHGHGAAKHGRTRRPTQGVNWQ